MNWIPLTRVENLPPREGRVAVIEGEEVAVFRLDDRVVALENRCPHKGGPLADGIVGGSQVTCPLHNWKICLDTGHVMKPCGHGGRALTTYEARVEGGIVYVAKTDAEEAAA